jgi:16S rRNA (uracil1498-N3)-methyltransferase
MSSLRLFVSAPLGHGLRVAASAGQAHYLRAVMRRGVGERALLFNGTDGEWQAELEELARSHAIFTVGECVRQQEPEPDLWLVFGLLKRDATDLVVQKATELGVSAIVPVLAERTVGTRVNSERLRAIATEAAEQSERLSVPQLCDPQPLATLLSCWPTGRSLIAAVERRPGPRPAASGPTALLVGPEGGFAPTELETLLSQPFVSAASLGPRILRAETACIVGLGFLSGMVQLQAPARG